MDNVAIKREEAFDNVQCVPNEVQENLNNSLLFTANRPNFLMWGENLLNLADFSTFPRLTSCHFQELLISQRRVKSMKNKDWKDIIGRFDSSSRRSKKRQFLFRKADKIQSPLYWWPPFLSQTIEICGEGQFSKSAKFRPHGI